MKSRSEHSLQLLASLAPNDEYFELQRKYITTTLATPVQPPTQNLRLPIYIHNKIFLHDFVLLVAKRLAKRLAVRAWGLRGGVNG